MLSNMLNDLAEAMKALDGKKADFLHFGASDFPSKNTFKKCFKIVFFFALASRSGLELQFPTSLRVVLLCFATQSLQSAL